LRPGGQTKRKNKTVSERTKEDQEKGACEIGKDESGGGEGNALNKRKANEKKMVLK